MTKIRFCALDVDGTLIGSDLRISPAVGAAVDRLHEAGIETAVVTGRTSRELAEVSARFPWIRYYIVSNGARAYDAHSGEDLVSNLLPLETARAIAREADKSDVMTEVYADGVSYVNAAAWANAAHYENEFLKHPSLGEARVPVPDVLRLLDERTADIDKLYISFYRREDLTPLAAFCRDFPVDLVVSIHNGLEVNRRGVEKGAALATLSARLGIAPEAVAAVGDGMADISMLRFAGLSIAMGNADASVREHARLTAPDNDHDGLVWAIEQILAAK